MPQYIQYEFVSLGNAGHRLEYGANRVDVAGYSITARSGATDLSGQAHHEAFARYDAPMDWVLLVLVGVRVRVRVEVRLRLHVRLRLRVFHVCVKYYVCKHT